MTAPGEGSTPFDPPNSRGALGKWIKPPDLQSGERRFKSGTRYQYQRNCGREVRHLVVNQVDDGSSPFSSANLRLKRFSTQTHIQVKTYCGRLELMKRISTTLLAICGVTISTVCLLVLLHAAHPLERKVYATSVVQTPTFTWSMQKRFGARRADGIVDYHWDGTVYEKDYVNPKGWTVEFNACSLPSSATSPFLWEIDGVAIQNPNPTSCNFSHEFAAQGTYLVRLTYTTSDGTQAILESPVTIKDLLIVSLGDSFASGQGNPDIPKHGSIRAKWVDEICARSAAAGPAQAARQIEDDDPHTSVTFISFACTGAQVLWGILGEQQIGQTVLPAQIDRLKDALKGRPIDALIISGGGNDIGFADLVTSCILHHDCSRDLNTLNKFSSGMDGLDARYLALSNRIAALPAVKKVFITEYPDVVHDERGKLCDRKPVNDPLGLISHDEATWASTVVISGLNQKIEKAANQFGWVFVTGISDKFKTHGYCARDTDGQINHWVRTYRESREIQGAAGKCNFSAFMSHNSLKDCIISLGTFHPTEEGHRAYSLSLIDALRQAGLIAPSGS